VQLREREKDLDEPDAFAWEFVEPVVNPRKFEEHRLSHAGHNVVFRNEELAPITEFDNASFSGGLYIAGNVFQRLTTFRDTTYGRIEMWDGEKRSFEPLFELFRNAEEKHWKRFEGTCWLQLESTLRKTGQIRDADAVYRERMSRELKWDRGPVAWCQRRLPEMWRLVSGYGTQPSRVAMLSLGVIFLFFIIFTSLDGGNWGSGLRESIASFAPFKLAIETEPNKLSAQQQALETAERLLGWFLLPALAATLLGAFQRAHPMPEITLHAE
jgi:hypothetical protein